MSDSTLAPNQYAAFDEYDRARHEHNRAASYILHEFLGAMKALDAHGPVDILKAQSWDRYAEKVREWDARRPEWVR